MDFSGFVPNHLSLRDTADIIRKSVTMSPDLANQITRLSQNHPTQLDSQYNERDSQKKKRESGESSGFRRYSAGFPK